MPDTAEQLRAAASEALAALPVVVAYLYGSQAGGEARPESDVDVGVVVEDGLSTDRYPELASRCADALAAATTLARIEVTVLNDAPLRFLGRVLRQRVVIYSRDEPFRVRYESLIGRMADDVEAWAARMDADLIAAIAEGRR